MEGADLKWSVPFHLISIQSILLIDNYVPKNKWSRKIWKGIQFDEDMNEDIGDKEKQQSQEIL
jgi:hypothetical protein